LGSNLQRVAFFFGYVQQPVWQRDWSGLAKAKVFLGILVELQNILRKVFFWFFGEILEKETLKIPERFDAEPRKARLVALATNAPDRNEFDY